MAEMQDVAFSQQYQIYMPFIIVSYFEDVQSIFVVLESGIFRFGPKVLGGSIFCRHSMPYILTTIFEGADNNL